MTDSDGAVTETTARVRAEPSGDGYGQALGSSLQEKSVPSSWETGCHQHLTFTSCSWLALLSTEARQNRLTHPTRTIFP